ncbi:MAG: 50S ribosomal protein L3 N(5)-glutamine methyltransferase [Candidatus Thiodiazotropha sp.]
MQSLRSITDYIRWTASRFSEAGLYFGHGTDNALDEAAALVLYALHQPPDLPQFWFSSRLTGEEQERVMALVAQRIETRQPLPYLTGEAWFAGLSFRVNEQVLIPRSPIAELIENEFMPWVEPSQLQRVLDLCCGSGCIGIATATYLPDCHVDLADISPAALTVASENVALHGLNQQVTLYESDLFGGLPGVKYDLILSNPPYVGAAEMAELPPEYLHEPNMALEANDQGLEIVKRILNQAPQFLTSDGILVMEVGNSAALLIERYPEVPFVWLDFAKGGEGVFLISAADLSRYAGQFL